MERVAKRAKKHADSRLTFYQTALLTASDPRDHESFEEPTRTMYHRICGEDPNLYLRRLKKIMACTPYLLFDKRVQPVFQNPSYVVDNKTGVVIARNCMYLVYIPELQHVGLARVCNIEPDHTTARVKWAVTDHDRVKHTFEFMNASCESVIPVAHVLVRSQFVSDATKAHMVHSAFAKHLVPNTPRTKKVLSNPRHWLEFYYAPEEFVWRTSLGEDLYAWFLEPFVQDVPALSLGDAKQGQMCDVADDAYFSRTDICSLKRRYVQCVLGMLLSFRKAKTFSTELCASVVVALWQIKHALQTELDTHVV